MNTDSARITVQGHRGCRGTLPENTIPSFLKAFEMGVDVLELDVVCTGDRRILISHDPFMHHEICAYPDRTPISAADEESLNIFQMTADSAQSFVCGAFPHPRFPDQNPLISQKPLLSELLELAKRENQSKERSFPALNIEIKSRPEWDGLFQPQVDEYTDLVLKEIEGYKNVQISIQSFDPRILRSIHEKDAALPLTYLTEDASQSVEEQLKALSFKPTSFSPHFSMVTDEMVAFCKKENVGLVVWTVNDEKDIRAMIEMGVTNLISDFPERIIPIRDSLSQ